MAIDSNIKKHITSEWLKALPDLSAFAQNKLYKIVGPFICGIELIKLLRSEEYRPHFVLYSLMENDLKTCLDHPVVMHQFYSSKNLQLNLPYHDTKGLLQSALQDVPKGLKIPFATTVTLKQLNTLIDHQLHHDMLCKAAGKRASLLKLKLQATLYVNDEEQIQNTLLEMQTERIQWDMQNFEAWHGSFDFWFEDIQKTLANRAAFIACIDRNKRDKKLAALQSSELAA